LVGIDLDHILDPATGEVLTDKPEAKEIIERFRTAGAYIERSPSGDGLHIWCKARAVKSGKGTQNKWIELYDHSSPRYFTVTGKEYKNGHAS